MTAFSLSARLHRNANSSLALSLPQSSPLYPVRLDSFAPSPFSARASAIRSRTCGRQRLAFLAVSATGGARKPNPSEGAEAALRAAIAPRYLCALFRIPISALRISQNFLLTSVLNRTIITEYAF